jgi:hypothetical protein
MKKLAIQDLIKCYRSEGRCKVDCEDPKKCQCPLNQPVKKMPNGIDENMAALVAEVLEPRMASYGKAIEVIEGFVCPRRCQLEKNKMLRLHVKGDTVKISAVGLQGNDLRLENLEIARTIIMNGKWDQIVLMDTTTTGVGPKSLMVSYSRGKNNGRILKKVEGSDEVVELSELDRAQLMSE